jgi:hypothetical protein
MESSYISGRMKNITKIASILLGTMAWGAFCGTTMSDLFFVPGKICRTYFRSDFDSFFGIRCGKKKDGLW